MQYIFNNMVSHDLRSPQAHAIALTEKILQLLANPISICKEDVVNKVDLVYSLIMRVHLKILDFIDLSSIERNEFKKENCLFDVRETILRIKNINSL